MNQYVYFISMVISLTKSHEEFYYMKSAPRRWQNLLGSLKQNRVVHPVDMELNMFIIDAVKNDFGNVPNEFNCFFIQIIVNNQTLQFFLYKSIIVQKYLSNFYNFQKSSNSVPIRMYIIIRIFYANLKKNKN